MKKAELTPKMEGLESRAEEFIIYQAMRSYGRLLSRN